MTADGLRVLVRERLAAKTTVEAECPRCGGSGRVTVGRPVTTQADLAAQIGTTRTSVTNFLAGRQTFGMDVTLRLLDWLEGPA